MSVNGRKIFIDIDCTVNNYAELWCKKLNEKFKKNVKYEDIIRYDINAVFQISQKATLSVIDDQFYDELKVLNLVHKNLKKLIEKGFNIYFVTSTPPNEAQMKANWIKQNFPYIDSKSIIYAEDKSVLAGDFFIDDNTYHIIESECKHKFIFTQPWNEFAAIHENVVRVYDWDQIYRKIIEITESENYQPVISLTNNGMLYICNNNDIPKIFF